MPEYAIKCDCGFRGDIYARMGARLLCPECHVTASIDWQRNGVPAAEREWMGQESVSLTERFHPDGCAEIKRECPSAEFTPDGRLQFRSNSHQRQVYRDFDRAMRRVRERKAEREGSP